MDDVKTNLPSLPPGIATWIQRRTLAESAQRVLFGKFKGFYDQFFAVVKNIQSPWRSKLYLPEYFSIIWTKASLLTNKPIEWEAIGRTPDDSARAQVIKEVMRYQIKEPHVQPTHYKRFTTGTLDALITGTAIYSVEYKMQTDTFRQYPLDDKTGKISTKNTEVKKRIARWNEFEPVPFNRFFIDPAATSIQTAQWIIVEEFCTQDYLKSQNAKTPNYYDNLNLLDDLGGATDTLSQYTTSRNSLLGTQDKLSEDKTVKYIRKWKCYERKYDADTGEPYVETSEIAGGQFYLRQPRRSMFWHNLFPFAVQYDYDRPHEFWGIGEIEASASVVKAINDNVNHFFDNINLSNNTMIMRKSSTILEPFIIEPGGEVIYDGEAPTQFRFPDPNGQTFQLAHVMLQQSLERASGVSGYLAGTPTAAVDQTRGTRGGIQQITQNAQTRMAYSLRQTGDFLEQVGRMFLSNIQQFFTEDFYVRLTNGQYAIQKPEDVRGEFDVYVTDSSLTPSTKAEKLHMLSQVFQSVIELAPLLAQEGKMIKVSQPLIDFFSLLDEPNAADMITDMPPPPPPKDEVKRNVSIALTGADLPNPVKAEILAEQFSPNIPGGAPAPGQGGLDLSSLNGSSPPLIPQSAGPSGPALPTGLGIPGLTPVPNGR